MSFAAEEFLIKMTYQSSGGAEATGTLAKLEAQIRKETQALGAMESKLGTANAKLAELMNGGGGNSASLAAVEKQRAAVAALQAQIEKQKAGIGGLEGARGQAAEIDAAKKAASEKVRADSEAAANKRVIDKMNADAQKRADADQKKSLANMKREQDKADRDARKADAERKRSQREAARATAKQGAEQKALTSDIAGALGPIGRLVQGLQKATGAAAAAVLLTVAVLAVAAAAIAAAAALVQYALAAADANRSMRLLGDAASGGSARGNELATVVDEIAAKVPIARERVAEFGRQLELAGINGRRMQIALETISAIESVVPGAGAKIEGLVERFQRLRRAVLTKADLQGTGLALQDVAAQLAKAMGITQAAALAMLQNGTASTDKVLDAMKKAVEQKFGKTLAGQMASLSVQFAKLRESVALLFADVDMEPFLEGLKTITDLFSQNTVTGRALKVILSGALQGFMDAASKVFPYVRAFMLGIAIMALRVYIAFKPIKKTIEEAFGGADKAQALSDALTAGKVVVYALIFAFGVLAAVVVLALAPIIEVGAALYALYQIGSRIVAVIGGAFNGIKASLMGLPATGAGAATGLIDGFVQGIQAKIGAVMAAVGSIGAAAEQALRNAIGWHSPATLGVDAATSVGEGFEVGADKAEGAASEAAGKIVNPKEAKAAAKAGKGGGKWVYIENFYGSDDNLAKLRAFLGGEFEFQGGT